MRDYTQILNNPGREGERLTFECHDGSWELVGGHLPDSALPEQYHRDRP